MEVIVDTGIVYKYIVIEINVFYSIILSSWVATDRSNKRNPYFPTIHSSPGADPAHFLTFSKVQNIKPHPKTTPKDHTQTIIIVLIIMPERSRTIEISKAHYLQNQD